MTPAPNHQKTCEEIIDCVGSVYVGHDTLMRKVLAAALADGHVLFEDAPGLGKTLLVKAFSQALGCDVNRVQFTPDLMPSDILGMKIWDSSKSAFRMEKGPIFTNILLGDEINRAPPKAQSALLEAMEERQVTIEGKTFPLDPPFFVLSTQNPLESEGTYPLPDAQMDRFLMRLRTGYAESLKEEVEILKRRIQWQENDPTGRMKSAITKAKFLAIQQHVETKVRADDKVLNYMGTIVRALREHPKLEIGPSPRGALALLRITRAWATIHGRDFVTPDDVREVAIDCLAHRCIVDVEHALDGFSAETAVDEVLTQVPVPGVKAPPTTEATE